MSTWQKLGIFSLLIKQKTTVYRVENVKLDYWKLLLSLQVILLKFIYSEKVTKFFKISTVDLTVTIHKWRFRKHLWPSQDKKATIKIMLFLLSIQLITLEFAAVSYFGGSFFSMTNRFAYKWGSQIVLYKARKNDSIKTRKHVQNMNGNLVLSLLCRFNVFISYFEAIFSHQKKKPRRYSSPEA